MNQVEFIDYLREKRIPVRAMVQLTYSCNFRCIHCYETPLKELQNPSLGLYEWTQILKTLREHGCMFLSFTGGEVFTVPLFSELYEIAYDLGFKISIISNGSILPYQMLEILSKKKPEKIHISLYGMSDNTYTNFCKTANGYQRVKRNILALRAARINTIIMYLTNKMNAHELKDAREFARDNGCGFYQFYRFRAFVNGDCTPQDLQLDPHTLVSLQTPEELNIIHEKEIKNRNQWSNGYKWCNAGLTSIMIDPFGKAFLCDSVPAERFSLLQCDFDDVWKKIYIQRKKYIEISSVCGKCDNREKCGLCAPTLLTEYGDCGVVPCRECQYSEELRNGLEVVSHV